jgi:phosphodiesterase/alkaline phosphatase D-like protein
MKKLLVFAIAMAFSATIALAQAKMSTKPMPEGSKQEEAAEKSVQITSGPTVSNVTGSSATITWTTNKNAATDVRYSSDGSHWRVAYQRGGERNHTVTLSGLKPNTNYTYRIMTREREIRTSGTFHTT